MFRLPKYTFAQRSGDRLSAFLASLFVASSSIGLMAVPVRADKLGDNLFTTQPPNIFYHNVGAIELFASNIGRFGNGQLGLDGLSLGWRGDEYLYLGALWIGGIPTDGIPRVSTGGYEFELLPSLDAVDTIYPSYEGIDHGNRNGFSSKPDDDGDGRIDEEFHNGKDEDGDGRVDEDFAALSEQMFSCEYWDYTELSQKLNPDHVPMNLRVRQRSFAWSIPGIDQFAGVEYTIINDGIEIVRDVYAGLFVDADAGSHDQDGYWRDDGSGFYTAKVTLFDPAPDDCHEVPAHLEMPYMFDVPDGILGASGGDVDGFVGLLYLGSTTDATGRLAPADARLRTVRIWNGSSPYPQGIPRDDSERYHAMSSAGTQARPTTTPADYSFLTTVGPFPTLEPGQSVQVTFAFVVGEGYYDRIRRTPHPELGTDGQPSEASLVANAIRLREVYQGRWKNLDGRLDTGVDGKETCIVTEPGEPFTFMSSCFGSGFQTFEGSSCDQPSSWVDRDCDPCTPNPTHEGCENGGCETLVHWYVPAVPIGDSEQSSSRDRDVDSPIRLRVTELTPETVVLSAESDLSVEVELELFDASGRMVTSLRRRVASTGLTEWHWDGMDRKGLPAPSGVYLARIRTEVGDDAIARFVLVR